MLWLQSASMAAASGVTRGDDAILIRPATRWVDLGLRELWRSRELLYFLTVRDLKVRYKQTILGIVWAVLQPVMYMVVFTLFFSRVTTLYTPGQDYAPLTLTGSVIWLFFANSVTLASGSLVGSSALITKVYFPRLLQAASPAVAALVDLALSCVVMLAIMAGYGYIPGARVLVVFPFLLLAMATAIGIGAWLAALNVKYRDVRFVVPFLLQLWMFASAVFYSATALELHEPWDTIFWANPMAGVVEGWRWGLLGGVRPAYEDVALSTIGGLVVLVAGVVYFRRKEREFADIV
jgi:lipopolysaccharide transport system permease protein